MQKYKYEIHKYTNTAYDEVPERPYMWYVFEKRFSGISKMIFPCIKCANTKHTNTKYTNKAYIKYC